MAPRAKAVLFVCSENVLRSPMAEAIAKLVCGTEVYVDSVGVRDGEIDPFVVEVLGEIGIGKNADGTLSFDATVLQNAFNSDAAGVTSLINEAAKAFDDFAEPFTRIGGTIDNASQRLQSQVNFLETRTSGADYALSVLQRQAIQQYSAIMAMATSQ